MIFILIMVSESNALNIKNRNEGKFLPTNHKTELKKSQFGTHADRFQPDDPIERQIK